jgi:hypothetical protein
MNLATLRVEGEEAALASLISRLGLDIDTSWKKGEPKRRGGEQESSGFNATVADAENAKEMLRAVRNFLERCDALDVSFISEGLSAELAIGVTVGDSEQFVAFVELSSAELASLGALGIALSFAAYPTSDEANAE